MSTIYIPRCSSSPAKAEEFVQYYYFALHLALVLGSFILVSICKFHVVSVTQDNGRLRLQSTRQSDMILYFESRCIPTLGNRMANHG